MYFEINIHFPLNECFLRDYYVISIVLDTGVAVINKTKGISSLCGVCVSAVTIDGDLCLKKPKTALQKGETDVQSYRQ